MEIIEDKRFGKALLISYVANLLSLVVGITAIYVLGTFLGMVILTVLVTLFPSMVSAKYYRRTEKK